MIDHIHNYKSIHVDQTFSETGLGHLWSKHIKCAGVLGNGLQWSHVTHLLVNLTFLKKPKCIPRLFCAAIVFSSQKAQGTLNLAPLCKP